MCHSLPYLTTEGTQLFMSVMQLRWRTRLYLCLHILRVLRDSLLQGEGSSLEFFLLNILKAPKEMEVESSEDSLLAAEIVHILEAVYKVYGPVLSQILHPTMRTELTRGAGFPQGLWVWHGDSGVDPERFVVLYYLHGGGYCFFDGITSHLELVTRMVAELQDDLSSAGWADVKVVAFILDYTLAPQAILPTQLEEAVECYKYILSQDRYPVEAGDIVISGDSAGGALNPMFTFTSVSRATFGGVPILLQAGGSEGFLEEILHFVKMTDDVVTLEVYEDRFHIFPMLSWIIPQGKVAIKRWASFSSSALMAKPLPLGQHLAVCPAGSVKPHPELDWDTAQSG
ncbi:hypothetical protein FOZ61_000156 [Perkinsus olseni]|uniref:Alpha/beta hydrolase fold-3 domain-containing protein n=1 Tax=Perkinsus olseni TaxID=32597 RepID=A0A7J6KTH6_PEROL|nr:hypothetical protein FOZ61_000156 [Perkinsus olseni]